MEFLFELIVDLLLEGVFEASKSKRLPRPIRYFLIALVVLVYLALIGIFVALGITLWSESMVGAILIFLLGAVVAAMCVLAFRKAYLKRKPFNDN